MSAGFVRPVLPAIGFSLHFVDFLPLSSSCATYPSFVFGTSKELACMAQVSKPYISEQVLCALSCAPLHLRRLIAFPLSQSHTEGAREASFIKHSSRKKNLITPRADARSVAGEEVLHSMWRFSRVFFPFAMCARWGHTASPRACVCGVCFFLPRSLFLSVSGGARRLAKGELSDSRAASRLPPTFRAALFPGGPRWS